MKVAEIMRVPPQFIIIAGIQASNSLLITFMVPGEYAHYLKDCKSEHIPILQLLSVDSWTVGDTTVTVKGSLSIDLSLSQQNLGYLNYVKLVEITLYNLLSRVFCHYPCCYADVD